MLSPDTVEDLSIVLKEYKNKLFCWTVNICWTVNKSAIQRPPVAVYLTSLQHITMTHLCRSLSML